MAATTLSCAAGMRIIRQTPHPAARQSCHRSWRRNRDELRLNQQTRTRDHGGQVEAMYQRFLGERGAATILAEKPSLFATLANFEALRRLPECSFGRAYLAVMESSGYGADGLLKASQLAAGLEEVLPGPDR